jgi:aspartate/methionine/tyrosine aminotransferase
VQHALPTILATRGVAESAIRERSRTNLRVLRERCARAPAASVLHVEGGWYAMVRVPDTRSDEEWVLDLVEHEGVHVQPGYFFDVSRGAHLVVSLLTPEDTFAEGATRMAKRIEAHAS